MLINETDIDLYNENDIIPYYFNTILLDKVPDQVEINNWNSTLLFIPFLQRNNNDVIHCEKGNSITNIGVIFSNTQKKGTTTSGYFDGNSSLILSETPPITTEDFTIECWVYPTESGKGVIFSQEYTTSNVCCLYINSSSKLVFINNSISMTSTNSVSLNAWTYITLQKLSGTYSLIINGVLDTSLSSSSNQSSDIIRIGISKTTNPTQQFKGYLSHFKITKSGNYSSLPFNPNDSLLPFSTISGMSYLGKNNFFIGNLYLVDNETNKTLLLTSDNLGHFSLSDIFKGKRYYITTLEESYRNYLFPVSFDSNNIIRLFESSLGETIDPTTSDVIYYEGSAKLKNGEPVSLIVVLDFSNGDFLTKIYPDSNGDFSIYLIYEHEYIFVYIGELPYKPELLYKKAI